MFTVGMSTPQLKSCFMVAGAYRAFDAKSVPQIQCMCFLILWQQTTLLDIHLLTMDIIGGLEEV